MFVEDRNGLPFDLKQTKFESVAAFRANAEVGEDKKAGIHIAILWVFEMIQTGDHRASGVSGSAIFKEDELIIGVGGNEGSKHKEVWVLQKSVG